MNEYIKRSDVLAMLPDTDTVGYKPSALREKVLALPTIRIVKEEPKAEKDADRDKMEKVHSICEEICLLIGDLVMEGVIEHIKGAETVLKLAGKHAEWLKKTFGEEKGRAFVDSVKDKKSPKEPPQRPNRTDKERLVYVDGISDKIAEKCAELAGEGMWDVPDGLALSLFIADMEIKWAKKNFDWAEVEEALKL